MRFARATARQTRSVTTAEPQTQQPMPDTPARHPSHGGLVQRSCACGRAPGPTGECEACRAQRSGLQRQAAETKPAPTLHEAIAPDIVQAGLRSPGVPLDTETRADLEPRFGRDFSQVRVHTGGTAATSAEAVHAAAYTVRQDVVFAAGQYAPGSPAGRRLLAHELAHVVQQGAGPAPAGLVLDNPRGEAEHEADQAAQSALHGPAQALAGPRTASGPAQVARETDDDEERRRATDAGGPGATTDTAGANPPTDAGDTTTPAQDAGAPMAPATGSSATTTMDTAGAATPTDAGTAPTVRPDAGAEAPATRTNANQPGITTGSPGTMTASSGTTTGTTATTDAGLPSAGQKTDAGTGAAAPQNGTEARQTPVTQPDAGTNTPPTQAGASTTPGTTRTEDQPAPNTPTETSANQAPEKQTTAGQTASGQTATGTTPAQTTPSLPPGTCPPAPARRTYTATCPISAPQAGLTPPAKESAAALPVLGSGDFGGDTDVANYAKALARCRAERTVKGETEKRYRSAVDQARKDAQAQAKLDKAQAIADAEAAVTPASGPGDKRRYDNEVAKARRAAVAQADRDAKQNIKAAETGVARPDPAVVQAGLEQKYLTALANDFRSVMEAVLREYGPGWQRGGLNRLNKARKDKLKALQAKPRVKKGETPPPAKTAEVIDGELETYMLQQRCLEDGKTQNWFEGFIHGWMVARREEVDFDTVEQKGVRAIPRGFIAPRDVPPAELESIPSELKSDPGNMPGVAPEVVGFLRALQKLDPKFTVGNYGGHGSAGFAGKGFSLDLYLAGVKTDDRGFWDHAAAVNFLLHLDQAAQRAAAEWRVLYDDFSVTEEVNRRLGVRRVVFTGNVDRGGKVNFHGPAPLKLHFHLDIAPAASLPTDPSLAP
jgi:hypothetical protein